jgi:2-alkenal reductase
MALLATAVLLITMGFIVGTQVLSTNASADTAPIESIAPIVEQDPAPPVSPMLTESEQRLAEIYDQVAPSVVAIDVIRRNSGFSALDDEVSGSGSGFVIDQQGHILTNFHVIQEASEIEVNFLDGTIARAEIIGEDPDSDLAVIQVNIPAERLYPVEFGSVDDLVIGQAVLAIGSPFGQEWTLTSGIISALERDILGLAGYAIGSAIQTDAPINPGNSGGPLLNLNGQVIGVNSQIISRSRSSAGIGFAVPADLAQRAARELIETGDVAYSFIGIGSAPITLDLINSLDIANNQRGVVVSSVEPGSPAEESGLREWTINGGGEVTQADIITAIDGEPITGFAKLIGYLSRKTLPGDTVMLDVLRNGELIQIPLTLTSREAF